MQGLNGDILQFLYYAAGVGVFVAMLVPLVLVGFLVFSMIPSMLFSRFYDRLYKRLGFLPETILFLVCCGVAGTLAVNVMGSPALCVDPLTPRNPERLAFYQVAAAQGAPLLAGAEGPSLGVLPQGTFLYAPIPATPDSSSMPVTRVRLPNQRQAVAINGRVASMHAAPGRFLEHPLAFAARQCQPAFIVNWRSLLRWPWSVATERK